MARTFYMKREQNVSNQMRYVSSSLFVSISDSFTSYHDYWNTIRNWNVRSFNSIMPKHNEYFIVEYRFPIKIESVKSVQEAMSMASQVFQNQYGFKPDNWNARVFQYSTDSNVSGYVKEFFYNPNSATHREITKNISYHADLIEKGELPEGIKKNE
jgi:hypothetical protein